MMRKLLVVGSLLLCLVIPVQAQEVSKMENVMTIHDEVMNKMGDVVSLVGKLQRSTIDSSSVGKAKLAAIEDLKTSNKAMVDWMQGFGVRFTADEMMKGKKLSVQKQQWLAEEEIKVVQLRDQVDNSIATAQKLLEN